MVHMLSEKANKIAILLCTYNGGQYLKEQLASYEAQSHTNWHLYVSDDGSSDETIQLLQDCQARWGGKLTILQGPRQGFARNFLSLVYNDSIQADYYSYSDQDDIWDKEKLKNALAKLPAPDMAALYCSRTLLVDGDNNEIGLSPLFTRMPTFGNALCQNIGGGNTMVFTDAAMKVLRSVDHSIPIPFHDWWTYIAITACGGSVFYDAAPNLRYRQHGRNLIGSNNDWNARMVRIKKLMAGQLRIWNDIHIPALQSMADKITPYNKTVLNNFAAARKSSFLPRLWRLKKSGVHRQSTLGNLGLMVATAFGKI